MNNNILKEMLERIKKIETEVYGNGNPDSMRTEIAKLKGDVEHLVTTDKWQTGLIIIIIIFLLALLGVDKIPEIF